MLKQERGFNIDSSGHVYSLAFPEYFSFAGSHAWELTVIRPYRHRRTTSLPANQSDLANVFAIMLMSLGTLNPNGSRATDLFIRGILAVRCGCPDIYRKITTSKARLRSTCCRNIACLFCSLSRPLSTMRFLCKAHSSRDPLPYRYQCTRAAEAFHSPFLELGPAPRVGYQPREDASRVTLERRL